MSEAMPLGLPRWLDNYMVVNAPLLDAEPEFRRWLEEEYVPIAGAWQY